MRDPLDRPTMRRSNIIWICGLAAGIVAGAIVAYSVAVAGEIPAAIGRA